MADQVNSMVASEFCSPAERAALRAALYNTLARFFLQPPAPDVFAAFISDEAREQVRVLLGEEAEAVLEGLKYVAAAGNREEVQEFYDLLAVPSPRYLTPFESAYRDQLELPDGQRRPRLCGPAMMAVERVYAASGLAMQMKELPDHAGCELAFLGELCAREASGYCRGDAAELQKDREAQQSFMQDHALQWLPDFLKRLETATRAEYLRVIARLAKMLLLEHSARLN